MATTVFVDPELPISQSLNSKLSELGYRRSGAHLYRPDCEHCSACISCRLPVEHFNFKRRHRKIWNINQDLEIKQRNDINCNDAYNLYHRYINIRHRDGDMYPATPEQFDAFIKTATGTTRFFSFYLEQQLVAVGVTDVLEHGLSAVYTFFDPSLPKRSLGIYVILCQIQTAIDMQLPYLFLGYWIKDCSKMHYKSSFRPIEMFVEGKWLLLN